MRWAVLVVASWFLVPTAAALPLVDELTLEGPAFALVGATVAFEGRHQTRFGLAPLPSSVVQLFVDGAPAGTDRNVFGAYAIEHVFVARGTYVVRAVSEEGQPTEVASPALTVRAAVPPTAPEGVAATALGGNPRVRVTWAAPLDDGGAPVTGYRVLRTTDGATWTERASLAGSAASFTDTGLSTFARYAYAVVAVNAVGASERAVAEVTGVVPSPPSLTVRPDGIYARLAATGDAATQAVEFQVSYDEGATWTGIGTVSGASPQGTDIPSFYMARPLYRGIARSVVGASAPGDVATPVGETPGTPTDVVVAYESGRFVLRWGAPADGGAVQKYRVTDTRGVVVVTGALSYDVTPYAASGPFRVGAASVVGYGPASDPVALPPAPTPTLVATPLAGTTTVRLAATFGGEPTDKLVLQRSSDAGGTWATVAESTADAFTRDETVSFAGALPLFRLRASAPTGDSPWVPATTSAPPPGTPLDVRLDARTLRWSAPADGGAVQQYRVVDGTRVVALLGPGVRSLSNAATPGVDFDLAVQALSYAGEGPLSARVAGRLEAPSAPTAFTATVVDGHKDARVDLAWEAPASEGTSPLLGYMVFRDPGHTWRPDGTQPRERIATLPPGTRTFTERVCAAPCTFTYDVVAYNEVGSSPGASQSVTAHVAWDLDYDVIRFRACQGTTCTDLAPGATYTRTGTAPVTYTATLGGVLTREGVPQGGEQILVTSYEVANEEGAEGAVATTAADGSYTVTWSGGTSGGACHTVDLRSYAQMSSWWDSAARSVTLC